MRSPCVYPPGLVDGMGTGQSIARVFSPVINLTKKKLQVKLMPGIYFRSTGEHQNLASTEEYTFVLNPLNGQNIEVNAVCINANRPIPGESDRFAGLGRVPKKMRRFLEKAMGEDPMTIQAGVWACTDGFTGPQIKKHLISRDQQGHSVSAVHERHIERARNILSDLNISTNL